MSVTPRPLAMQYKRVTRALTQNAEYNRQIDSQCKDFRTFYMRASTNHKDFTIYNLPSSFPSSSLLLFSFPLSLFNTQPPSAKD